jgi:hypothetical protein
MTMSVGKPQKSKSRLGLYIFIALVLGIIAGQTAHIGITENRQ